MVPRYRSRRLNPTKSHAIERPISCWYCRYLIVKPGVLDRGPVGTMPPVVLGEDDLVPIRRIRSFIPYRAAVARGPKAHVALGVDLAQHPGGESRVRVS